MIPARVRSIRQRAGLTQAGLADLLRVADRATVGRWEAGAIAVPGPASIVLELLEADELPARFHR